MMMMVMVRAQRKTLAHGILKLLPQRAARQGLPTHYIKVRRRQCIPKSTAATLSLSAPPRTGCWPHAQLFRPLRLQPSGTRPVARAPGAFLPPPDITVCTPTAETTFGTRVWASWLLLWHGCFLICDTFKTSADQEQDYRTMPHIINTFTKQYECKKYLVLLAKSCF